MRKLVRLFLLVTLAILIFIVPAVLPLRSATVTVGVSNLPPSPGYLLGTDSFGRDVFSRTLTAAQTSITGGLLAALLAVLFGFIIGAFASLGSRLVDSILMRTVDIFLALPGLLIAFVVLALFDVGRISASIAVAVALAPVYARLARASILSVKGTLYIDAAFMQGASTIRALLKHILPNAATSLMSHAALMFAYALLNLAALEFLGLAGSPTTPTFGRLLEEGRRSLHDAPWVAASAGGILTLTVVLLSSFSDSFWRPVKIKNAAEGKGDIFL